MQQSFTKRRERMAQFSLSLDNTAIAHKPEFRAQISLSPQYSNRSQHGESARRDSVHRYYKYSNGPQNGESSRRKSVRRLQLASVATIGASSAIKFANPSLWKCKKRVGDKSHTRQSLPLMNENGSRRGRGNVGGGKTSPWPRQWHRPRQAGPLQTVHVLQATGKVSSLSMVLNVHRNHKAY